MHEYGGGEMKPALPHISLCPKCNCMTKTTREVKMSFYCGKCKGNKNLTVKEWIGGK